MEFSTTRQVYSQIYVYCVLFRVLRTIICHAILTFVTFEYNLLVYATLFRSPIFLDLHLLTFGRLATHEAHNN